jgi:hypothetical protein
LIGVSLVTKSESAERIEAFFEKMRYSSDDDARATDGRRILAEARGEDLLMLDLPGWLRAERWRGFFRRYREDLIGFALGWCTVLLLVGAAWGLMQVGR